MALVVSPWFVAPTIDGAFQLSTRFLEMGET
jgi:hypothetical protein